MFFPGISEIHATEELTNSNRRYMMIEIPDVK